VNFEAESAKSYARRNAKSLIGTLFDVSAMLLIRTWPLNPTPIALKWFAISSVMTTFELATNHMPRASARPPNYM
jgi:hypothetical protein